MEEEKKEAGIKLTDEEIDLVSGGYESNDPFPYDQVTTPGYCTVCNDIKPFKTYINPVTGLPDGRCECQGCYNKFSATEMNRYSDH